MLYLGFEKKSREIRVSYFILAPYKLVSGNRSSNRSMWECNQGCSKSGSANCLGYAKTLCQEKINSYLENSLRVSWVGLRCHDESKLEKE